MPSFEMPGQPTLQPQESPEIKAIPIQKDEYHDTPDEAPENGLEEPVSLTRVISETNNPRLIEDFTHILQSWKESQHQLAQLQAEKQQDKERIRLLEIETQASLEKITLLESMLQERSETIAQFETLIQSLSMQNQNNQESLKQTKATVTALKEKNAILELEIKKLSYDNLTNLQNRSAFYKQLNTISLQYLENILPSTLKDWETASFESILQGFISVNKDHLASVPLTILNGDGSGVSVANSESHSKGDELISLYGDASKRTMDQFPDTFDIFRYGGDEFTAIMYENETSKVSTMTETFTKEIHKTEFPYFAQFGIDPHLSLDIGTARFDEGVRAFTDLLQSIQAYNEQCADTTEHITIPPGKRMRAFLDLWMNIADERAIIQKAETRIEKLQEYKIKQPPIHKNIIDILRKGALHITDETLRVLPQDSDIIKFYVLETRKKNHKNSQEQPDVVTLLEKFSDDVIQKNVIEPELEKFMSINYIDTLYPTDSR